MGQEVRHDVIIGGVGGKGVQVAGRLLAEAALARYEHVTWFPNYAGSMRGGDSECTVVMSIQEIDSPVVLNPSAAIIMELSALRLFQDRVKPGGIIVVDGTIMGGQVRRDDVKVCSVPATDVALKLGSLQVANLVLLGAYLEVTKAVPLELVEEALDRSLAGTRREHLLPLNKKALREGARLAAGSLP